MRKRRGNIHIDPDDLPFGSSRKLGATSTIHGAGELHPVARIGEFPGVMRYEDALSQGQNAKFNVRKRLEHEKSVRDFFKSRGRTAEGEWAALPGREIRKSSTLEKALKVLGAAVFTTGAVYGGRRVKKLWLLPANWSRLSPAQSRALARLLGPEKFARMQRKYSRGAKSLVVPAKNVPMRKSPRVRTSRRNPRKGSKRRRR